MDLYYYRYKELREAAINNPTKENLERLADWLFHYGDCGWNGEEYDIDDGYYLRPIYKQVDEDEWEVVDYELHR